MWESVRPAPEADAAAEARIELLGGLRIFAAGESLALPRSRKARALLAYLLLADRPRRREHLCEVFWDGPDDPRGALRWALSRLRALLAGTLVVIEATRDHVAAKAPVLSVDLLTIRKLVARTDTGAEDLEALRASAVRLRAPLLEGADLHEAPLFQAWLTAERDAAAALRSQVLARLCRAGPASGAEALLWAREWVESDPASEEAAAMLSARLEAGRGPESAEGAAISNAASTSTARQRVRFCTASDGVRIAYGEVGRGPPLVKAANWLNHLEYDWDSPVWAPMFRALARDHRFVRYDERGNGLSDWDVEDLSFEAFVRDLETVVDAAGVDRFPLLGISQGAAVAIAYAARHPERVSHLVLSGAYASGWRISAPELTAEREAVITLVRQGWGRDDPTYRQIFSSTFMPSATSDELAWFNDFQRRTASPENAARFLEVFSRIDVRPALAQVRAPTLVLHARGDRRIPIASAQEIAGSIPDVEFVVLDTNNHMLLGREPAAEAFVTEVRRFLAAAPGATS